MIHLTAVHEFVDDDVIANPGRSLHQPPVQRNDSAVGAGSPAGRLIANRHRVNGYFVNIGKGLSSSRKLGAGERDQMPLHGPPQIRIGIGEKNPFVRKPDKRPPKVPSEPEFDMRPAKQNDLTLPPIVPVSRHGCPLLRVLDDPAAVFLNKCNGLALASIARDGDNDISLAIESQGVPPGQRMTSKNDPRRLRRRFGQRQMQVSRHGRENEFAPCPHASDEHTVSSARTRIPNGVRDFQKRLGSTTSLLFVRHAVRP